MKKKTVKMVSSVAVLAVLCGAYFGVKTYTNKLEEREKQKMEAEETKTNVFSADAQDIQSLRFVIDNDEVTFTKEDEIWIKEDEKAFPVSQDKMDTAIGAIDSIDVERVLENVEDLSEYGLDNPSNTIVVKTKNDETETETTFHIGDKNDSTGQYYMSKGDDGKTVYLASETVVEPFVNGLYDYAESDAFPAVDAATVTKVQVEGKETSYILEKEKDTGFWSVGTDNSDMEKSDSAKAGSLTSAIGSMAYDAFVNYNAEDLSEYGLEKPFAKITVDYTEEQEIEEEKAESEDTEAEDAESSGGEVSNGEDETEKIPDTITVEKQLVIAVGNETADDSRYVSVDGSNQIYTISNTTLDSLLGKTVSDFWDMTVNYLSANNLESLQIEHAGVKHTVNVSRETLENEETVKYQLDGEELDETTFQTFYNKLINMAGQKRLTEAFEPEMDAEMTVNFTSTKNEKTEVKYYAYDTNFYAAVVNEKVYLVNKMTVKDMMDACDDMMTGENESKKIE